jgi:hypothetical protein
LPHDQQAEGGAAAAAGEIENISPGKGRGERKREQFRSVQGALPMLHSTTTFPVSEHLHAILDLLGAIGIDEVTYSLSGGGDSGETELESVHYLTGNDASTLPFLPIGFNADGSPKLLAEYLEDAAADLPDGDWVNNEGGFGSVTFAPTAADPDDRIDIDMTYRPDGDYGDDDDDPDGPFDDLDFDVGEEPVDADGPIATPIIGEFVS